MRLFLGLLVFPAVVIYAQRFRVPPDDDGGFDQGGFDDASFGEQPYGSDRSITPEDMGPAFADGLASELGVASILHHEAITPEEMGPPLHGQDPYERGSGFAPDFDDDGEFDDFEDNQVDERLEGFESPEYSGSAGFTPDYREAGSGVTPDIEERQAGYTPDIEERQAGYTPDK